MRIKHAMANMCWAPDSPLHSFDCHIRNHSLPTLRKAESHISRLSVSATTPNFLAALKTAALACKLRMRRTPAHHKRTPVTISQQTTVAKNMKGTAGAWMARHLPWLPGYVVSINSTCRTNVRLEL